MSYLIISDPTTLTLSAAITSYLDHIQMLMTQLLFTTSLTAPAPIATITATFLLTQTIPTSSDGEEAVEIYYALEKVTISLLIPMGLSSVIKRPSSLTIN